MRWDLLNTHGMLSSVAPAYYMQGMMQMPYFPGYLFFNLKYLKSQTNFLSFYSNRWLGKNSTATRRNRQLSELQMHMRSVASADKSQVMLDYIPAFQLALTKPLIDRGAVCVTVIVVVNLSLLINWLILGCH